MRVPFGDALRGTNGAQATRARAFGSARATARGRLAGILSPESLIRLVLAFVLATVLWLFVNSHNAPEVVVPYPQPVTVSALQVPQGLVIRNSIPPVHLTIRPTVGGLSATQSDFVATVNLTGLTTGTHHVPVNVSSAAASVVGVSPRAVPVILDHFARKRFRVQIHPLGTLPYGYALKHGNLSSSPKYVHISGAKTVVDEVKGAAVNVPLQNVRSSINQSFEAELVNAQGHGLSAGHISVSPRHIRIHGRVQQLASYKALPVIASVTGEPPPGYEVKSLSTDPSTISAFGAPRSMNSVQYIKTVAIDVSELGPGKHVVHSRLKVPEGVYVQKTSVSATVEVTSVNSAARTVVQVQHWNLGPGLRIKSIQPSSVIVGYSGLSTKLSQAAKRIRSHVTLRGLAAGKHTISVVVTKPAGISVNSVSPRTVVISVVAVGG